jgi:hypothetical protein
LSIDLADLLGGEGDVGTELQGVLAEWEQRAVAQYSVEALPLVGWFHSLDLDPHEFFLFGLGVERQEDGLAEEPGGLVAIQ